MDFREYSLSSSQALVLKTLREDLFGIPVRAGEVARFLGISVQNAQKALNALRDLGLVKYSPQGYIND